jgi:SAM-dependent methyltransferase
MTPRLPVDYSRHEDAYRELRARGAAGWSNDDEYAAMLDLVAPALPPAVAGASPRVLELGCGAGNLSLVLAGRGYVVTGVDISGTAVAWAAERARASNAAAAFRVDDVVALASCGSAAFDAVVDGHCLHCIVGDDRARCFAAVRRVLKPGGVFVVLTMCGEVRDERLLRRFDPLARVVVLDGRPVRYIGSADAIVAEVAAAGFDIGTVRVVARRIAAEQDDLFIRATKPTGPPSAPGAIPQAADPG